MNVTLALDDELVARAREVAAKQGTTLNEMLRRYLERVAGQRQGAVLGAALQRLWDSAPGHSGGRKLSREDAYADRLGRL